MTAASVSSPAGVSSLNSHIAVNVKPDSTSDGLRLSLTVLNVFREMASLSKSSSVVMFAGMRNPNSTGQPDNPI